jgi:hypothetical protein
LALRSCDLDCRINKADGSNTAGTCDAFIASGGWSTCATDFGPGLAYAGQCDFSCGFCPDKAASCRTTNAYDDANGAPGQCLALVMAGTTTCAGNFAHGQNYAGYCNALCGFNLADTSSTVGLCSDLIASGDTCAADFQIGQPNEGVGTQAVCHC